MLIQEIMDPNQMRNVCPEIKLADQSLDYLQRI